MTAQLLLSTYGGDRFAASDARLRHIRAALEPVTVVLGPCRPMECMFG